MARVLITGASGKIGRCVVAELVARGHAVRALYRTAPGDSAAVEWLQGDLGGSGELRSMIEGCDAVVHLAAELRQRSLMDAVNVRATERLAAESERQGVRYFGYASSIVVYGSPRKRLVDESTPRLDPSAPMSRQYYAESYMLDYARTKAAGEIAIEAQAPKMVVDFYRPAVVIDDADLLAVGNWSTPRKILFAYRRTQFVTARDTAAAIAHLMERGLTRLPSAGTAIEAYNIVDDSGGTYRSLFADAYRVTADARFKVPFEVPVLADLAKDFVRYRHPQIRYPLGMLMLSNKKLRNTGFVFGDAVGCLRVSAESHLRSQAG